MKSDNSKGNIPNNVIDMTERIPSAIDRLGLSGLKVRFDLEHAKIAVSTSLLSIVILVTLANNNLMTSINPVVTPLDEAVPSSRGSRGIASVPGANQVAAAIPEYPQLVKALARRGLGPTASVGQTPSALDRLAFGFSKASTPYACTQARFAKSNFLRNPTLPMPNRLLIRSSSLRPSGTFCLSMRTR